MESSGHWRGRGNDMHLADLDLPDQQTRMGSNIHWFTISEFHISAILEDAMSNCWPRCLQQHHYSHYRNEAQPMLIPFLAGTHHSKMRPASLLHQLGTEPVTGTTGSWTEKCFQRIVLLQKNLPSPTEHLSLNNHLLHAHQVGVTNQAISKFYSGHSGSSTCTWSF